MLISCLPVSHPSSLTAFGYRNAIQADDAVHADFFARAKKEEFLALLCLGVLKPGFNRSSLPFGIPVFQLHGFALHDGRFNAVVEIAVDGYVFFRCRHGIKIRIAADCHKTWTLERRSARMQRISRICNAGYLRRSGWHLTTPPVKPAGAPHPSPGNWRSDAVRCGRGCAG